MAKLEGKIAELEAEETAGWTGCNALAVKAKTKVGRRRLKAAETRLTTSSFRKWGRPPMHPISSLL